MTTLDDLIANDISKLRLLFTSIHELMGYIFELLAERESLRRELVELFGENWREGMRRKMCLTCSGDGLCHVCLGTGKFGVKSCQVCGGTRKCQQCSRTGEIGESK